MTTTKNFNEIIGQNIRRMRKAKHLTQAGLAVAIDCTHSSVSHWEAGMVCPSAYHLRRLADVFGCSADELLGRED